MVKMTDDSNVASEIRKVHHICHESNRHIMRQCSIDSSFYTYSLLNRVSGRSFSVTRNLRTLTGAMMGSDKGCVSSS